MAIFHSKSRSTNYYGWFESYFNNNKRCKLELYFVETQYLSVRLARGTRKKTLLYETKIQIEKFYFGEIGKHRNCMNGLTVTSDQARISPYDINTISSRQAMRIQKNINNWGIIS